MDLFEVFLRSKPQRRNKKTNIIAFNEESLRSRGILYKEALVYNIYAYSVYVCIYT